MCLIITHAQILYSGVLCVEHISQREAKLGRDRVLLVLAAICPGRGMWLTGGLAVPGAGKQSQ